MHLLKGQFKVINISQFSLELHCELSVVLLVDMSTIVVSMYMSPKDDLNEFSDILEIEKCLCFLTSYNMHIIISSDHNINLLKLGNKSDFGSVSRSFGPFVSSGTNSWPLLY